MNKAITIADAFLSLSQPDIGDAITHLKLQKLLYYAQGFYLAMNGKPLFKEEIVAWEHGPVVKDVYTEYRTYTNEFIPQPENLSKTISNDDFSFIKNIWEVYGQFSAWKLRNMTHNESPWKTTKKDSVISHTKLQSYFKTLLVNENG